MKACHFTLFTLRSEHLGLGFYTTKTDAAVARRDDLRERVLASLCALFGDMIGFDFSINRPFESQVLQSCTGGSFSSIGLQFFAEFSHYY